MSWDQLEYGTGDIFNLHYGLIHKGLPTQIELNKCTLPNIKGDFIPTRYTLCKEGDVVFADASEDTNDVGKVVEFLNCDKKNVVCGLHTIHGRDKYDLTIEGFKGYAFSSKSFRSQIKKLAQGTKIYSISPKNFQECHILIPDKEEQNKIGKLLYQIDERISTQNKIIKQYKSLIKELSEKIFSRSFHFKDTVGNDFPNWEDKVLGEIGESFNGLSGKTKEDFGKGKLYIQYKQIFDSPIIDVLNCGLVNITRVEFQNKVQFGDIFFTVSSETPDEIGMSSVLLDKVSEMYLNSFCFAYRVFSFDILNPLFASYLFRCSLFRDKLIRIAQGSTRYNISKVEFMKLKISLPSIREQAIIASFLSTLDEKIKIEKKMLEQYANQRNYLLYRMFI